MTDADVKVFDFTDDDEDVKPDIPFKIKYQRKEYKENPETKQLEPTGKWKAQTEDFMARGSVPAGLTMSTLAAFSGRGSVATAAVLDFMRRVLVDEDQVRFLTLIDDDDVKVRMQNIANLVDWLLSEYGERPTVSA